MAKEKGVRRVSVFAAFAAVLVGSVTAATFVASGAGTTPPVFVKATCTAATTSCNRSHINTIEQFLGSVYPPPPPSSSSPPPSSTPASSTPPSSTPPASTPPSSTASSSPPPTGSGACVTTSPSGVCGPYAYPQIVNSNGYNTYVENNCWADPQCKATLSANSPGNWQVVATEPAGNTSVKTYPNVQQLFNNWDWRGSGCGSSCSDTPLASLKTLSSSYTETTPRGGTIGQFAWDIWTNNNSGPGEIMVWVDNSGRGNGGATQVGTATIAGQAWTIYQYGSGELIWSLGAPGTFAQQGSGTVDLLAILQASVQKGFTSAGATIGQIDAGWEICSTGGAAETFAVSSYSLAGS